VRSFHGMGIAYNFYAASIIISQIPVCIRELQEAAFKKELK